MHEGLILKLLFNEHYTKFLLQKILAECFKNEQKEQNLPNTYMIIQTQKNKALELVHVN